MTSGFVEALRGGGWAVPGVLHQTRVYRECVEPMPGRVAYFLVDALRFEMGRELADQLQGALELSVRPAVAALPTITPVGMAALLPGLLVELRGRRRQIERGRADRGGNPGRVGRPTEAVQGQAPTRPISRSGSF